MTQQYLPGMGLTKEDERAILLQARLEQTYTCRRCPTKGKAVAWDPSIQAFICHECGQVDRKHTREISH